ncbi:MAG: hypothetical protein DRO52_04055 [Candidatus Hecatellales archaeon]|nr:MAG: hypothetical protein DRO52_04055 [Candidatus Hecatellales archaeon]
MLFFRCLETVRIDLPCSLQALRRFLILCCCQSFLPEEYVRDDSVFPERLGVEGKGVIYVEAVDKVSLKQVRDVMFVRASEVIGATYTSKSGSTRLRWERTSEQTGRLKGEASVNAVLKLVEAGIISEEIFKEL